MIVFVWQTLEFWFKVWNWILLPTPMLARYVFLAEVLSIYHEEGWL